MDINRPAMLRDFFSGLAEHAFEVRLGVADPPLVDYLAELLERFVRADAQYCLRNLAGRRLEEVADMLSEAEARLGEARRDIHRHIGDYTLFWTGVYPEALPRMQGSSRKDRFIDYCAQGKRAYYIAGTICDEQHDTQGAILKRLSHEFDMCVYGLGEVRRQWERRESGGEWPMLWIA